MAENIIEPHNPFGGVFDNLWNPKKDEPEYQYTKDPLLMTPEEKEAEMGCVLQWIKMTPEQREAEAERRKADKSLQTRSASGDSFSEETSMMRNDMPSVEAQGRQTVSAEISDPSTAEKVKPSAEKVQDEHPTIAENDFIPYGEGVLIVPAEPTVIPETCEPKRMRITELVKEAFEGWRDGTRIVFDAGVNSGKTYFILNILLSWAHKKHWKILYLCNRIPLRDQIQQEVERLGRIKKEVGHWDDELQQYVYETRIENKYEDTIRVETYQWMESFCKGNPEGAMNYLKSFNYIVADEYHYLLTDSTINKYIDISYVTLNDMTKYRPVIFMSATAHPFFHRWRHETNEVLPENYYYIPSDYSYIKRAVFYWTDAEEIAIIRQEAKRGKVLVFVDQIAHMKKLVRELQDEFAGEIATACSTYRPEAKECDGLEEVLQDERLRKRITIVTTVFYNGVNIKDPELICIISRLWDPIVNAQILGRKRPVSKQDTCTVYFKGYSHERIKQEREHIRKRQLEPADKWKEGKSDPEVWQTYLHKPGIVEMLDKYSRTVGRDEFGDGWVWRRRAEHQYRVQMDALELMMEKGYQWGMLYAVTESEQLLNKIEPLRFEALESYITEHLEKPVLGEIMRKELTERGCITNPNDRHKVKSAPSLTILNRRLKDYGVVVRSCEKRINAKEKATFWTLYRL